MSAEYSANPTSSGMPSCGLISPVSGLSKPWSRDVQENSNWGHRTNPEAASPGPSVGEGQPVLHFVYSYLTGKRFTRTSDCGLTNCICRGMRDRSLRLHWDVGWRTANTPHGQAPESLIFTPAIRSFCPIFKQGPFITSPSRRGCQCSMWTSIRPVLTLEMPPLRSQS